MRQRSFASKQTMIKYLISIKPPVTSNCLELNKAIGEKSRLLLHSPKRLRSNPRAEITSPCSVRCEATYHYSSVLLSQRLVVSQMQKSSLLRRGIHNVLQGKRGGGAVANELPSALLPRLYSCNTTRHSRPIGRPGNDPKLNCIVPLQPSFIPPSLGTKSLSRHCSSSASSTLLKIMADRDVLPDVYVLRAMLHATDWITDIVVTQGQAI